MDSAQGVQKRFCSLGKRLFLRVQEITSRAEVDAGYPDRPELLPAQLILNGVIDGPLAGYLSTTAPDSQSALVPFIQSNGLLLQGLTGTPSAYLWSVQTGTVNHTDHYYLTTGSPPSGYTSEGTTAYIDGASSGGTVALLRYANSTTGHHYYSTISDPPSGFSGGTTIGRRRDQSAVSAGCDRHDQRNIFPGRRVVAYQ